MVRICGVWWAKRFTIRTIREAFKRIAEIAVNVIDHKLEVIVEEINRIDESIDDILPEGGVAAVAIGRVMEEKDHAVVVDQLGFAEGNEVDNDDLSECRPSAYHKPP